MYTLLASQCGAHSDPDPRLLVGGSGFLSRKMLPGSQGFIDLASQFVELRHWQRFSEV